MDYPVIFHADSHPDILWPRKLVGDLFEPLRSLGEDLEGKMRASRHHGENLLNEIQWHLGMEEITHGIDEDHCRLFPSEWNFECARMHRDF